MFLVVSWGKKLTMILQYKYILDKCDEKLFLATVIVFLF